MIERTSHSAFPALTNSEVAEWLRIDEDSDTFSVALLIDSACEYVEGETGQALASASYVANFDDYAGNLLALRITPVTAIASVNYTVGTTTTAITDFIFQAGSSPRIILPTCIVADRVTVAFTAGRADLSDVPLALRQAVAVLVSAGYNNREELDDQTFKTVTNLIARYRRVTL